MKKFEYKLFNIQALIQEKSKNKTVDTFKAYELVLSDIGLEGWELFTINHDVIGKRELIEKKKSK